MSNNIVAIIITFNPSKDNLLDLLASLKSQVNSIVVVDNTEDDLINNYLSVEYGDVFLINFKSNQGIAVAQNAGIQHAKDNGATDVILFDQDSLPASDMIEKLLEARKAAVIAGHKVAGVGPRFYDDRQENPPPFIQIKGLRVVRHKCDHSSDLVEVDYLISSGCLIPIQTLDAVGLMEDQLFIDYVDIEWGMRAQSLGYQSFGVCGALMKHSLGDNPISFMGRKIPLHSPLRHYYHFRNSIWLSKQKWVKTNWKIVDTYKLAIKFIFYSFFADNNKLMHAKMMLIGIVHGFRGKMGKYESAKGS